jgi:hypothetical protein
MNLVIIPIDRSVYVDSVTYSDLDLSFVPANVHALQWENNKGWVEFKNLEDGTKPQNQEIIELPSWASACKVKWDEAKAAHDAIPEYVPLPTPTKEELMAKLLEIQSQLEKM